MWEEERRPFPYRASERDVKPPPHLNRRISFVRFAFLFRSLFAICDMCSLLCRHRVRHGWQRRTTENKLKSEKAVQFSDGLDIYCSRRVLREHVFGSAARSLFHLCTLDTAANTNERGWWARVSALASVQCIPLFPRRGIRWHDESTSKWV